MKSFLLVVLAYFGILFAVELTSLLVGQQEEFFWFTIGKLVLSLTLSIKAFDLLLTLKNPSRAVGGTLRFSAPVEKR